MKRELITERKIIVKTIRSPHTEEGYEYRTALIVNDEHELNANNIYKFKLNLVYDSDFCQLYDTKLIEESIDMKMYVEIFQSVNINETGTLVEPSVTLHYEDVLEGVLEAYEKIKGFRKRYDKHLKKYVDGKF